MVAIRIAVNCEPRFKTSKLDNLLRAFPRVPCCRTTPLVCALKFRYTPSTAGEFHERLWEALSGTTSEKRGVPSRTGGERILEMLWKPQMPWIIGFGGSQPYSREEFQETLSERFFPEFFRNFFWKVPAVLGVWPRKFPWLFFLDLWPSGSLKTLTSSN